MSRKSKSTKGFEDLIALADAIKAEDMAKFYEILPKVGDVNIEVPNSWPLLLIAVKFGNPDMIQALIDKGLIINNEPNGSSSGLYHMPKYFKNWDVLIDNGAPIYDFPTPKLGYLSQAFSNGQKTRDISSFEYLLKSGFNPTIGEDRNSAENPSLKSYITAIKNYTRNPEVKAYSDKALALIEEYRDKWQELRRQRLERVEGFKILQRRMHFAGLFRSVEREREARREARRQREALSAAARQAPVENAPQNLKAPPEYVPTNLNGMNEGPAAAAEGWTGISNNSKKGGSRRKARSKRISTRRKNRRGLK